MSTVAEDAAEVEKAIEDLMEIKKDVRSKDARERARRLAARAQAHDEFVAACREALGPHRSTGTPADVAKLHTDLDAARAFSFHFERERDVARADNAVLVEDMKRAYATAMHLETFPKGITEVWEAMRKAWQPHPGAALLEEHRLALLRARNEAREAVAKRLIDQRDKPVSSRDAGRRRGLEEAASIARAMKEPEHAVPSVIPDDPHPGPALLARLSTAEATLRDVGERLVAAGASREGTILEQLNAILEKKRQETEQGVADGVVSAIHALGRLAAPESWPTAEYAKRVVRELVPLLEPFAAGEEGNRDVAGRVRRLRGRLARLDALERWLDKAEAEARTLPIGRAEHGGPFDGVPTYDLVMRTVREVRAVLTEESTSDAS